MEFISEKTADGGMIHRIGSIDQKNILVILGRNNFAQDEALIRSLSEELYSDSWTVVQYEHEGIVVAKEIGRASDLLLIRHKRFFHALQKYFGARCSGMVLKKYLKRVLLLQRPHWWFYFFCASVNNQTLIDFQEARTRKFLQSLGEDRNVILLSRSAGGRVSVAVSNEPCVSKLICLGYPFKHPERPEDIRRTAPLATVNKPFLILQGEHDTYGGKEVLGRYPLSPQVTIEFIEADHDFHMRDSEWQRSLSLIKTFMGVR